METLVIILLIFSILALFSFVIATFFFVKNSILYKEELETPEDKNGLYDFINIKDNIISIVHIVNIKCIKPTNGESYKIMIELDDFTKEPIIFDYDDDYEMCNNTFEELITALDAAIIVTD